MLFNSEKFKELKARLDSFKKINLANLPTPLHEAPNLSKYLNGPKILMKREDLTGLAYGGNKTRMFEYSLSKVLDEGYDTIIAGAAVQSNYCRQMAAACAKIGLDVYLVLRTVRGEKDYDIQGNLLLDLLAGANVNILEGADREQQKEFAEDLAKRLKKKGKKPYIARGLNEQHIGYDAIAYVNCMVEIFEQLQEREIEPEYIYVASNDSTHAGLLFAAEYLESPIKIVAINPMREIIRARTANERISNICKKISETLSIELEVNPQNIYSIPDYVGDGYGIITKECREAINIVAKTEGIFLDPVYSGKAMAGLIDHIKSGRLSRDCTVVFIHTGGNPLLFAYADELGFGNQFVKK